MDLRQFKKFPVTSCARCGHDHAELLWYSFEHPVVDDDGTLWDRWATCPRTGDPILMSSMRMPRGGEIRER